MTRCLDFQSCVWLSSYCLSVCPCRKFACLCACLSCRCLSACLSFIRLSCSYTSSCYLPVHRVFTSQFGCLLSVICLSRVFVCLSTGMCLFLSLVCLSCLRPSASLSVLSLYIYFPACFFFLTACLSCLRRSALLSTVLSL